MAAEGREMRKTEHYYRTIPAEIEHDILVRLPAKSLVRFKCVCKGWRSLISSHDFEKENLNHIKQLKLGTSKSNDDVGHRIIISSPDSILSIKYDPSFGNSNTAVESRVERIGLPFKSSRQMTMSKVLGSYNGLLCLVIYRDWISKASILFWNPCTGQQFEAASEPASPRDWDKFAEYACGFGYDKCSDDYKVVSIRKRRYYNYSVAAVYSLKAKAWCTSNLPPDSIVTQMYVADDGSKSKRGTFVDGMLYWISGRSYLIGFDVKDENFEMVEAPERMRGKIARLGVSGSEGTSSCLLIITGQCNGMLEVWKLLRPEAEVDDEDSGWTMFMRISVSSCEGACSSIVPLCFGNGKVLVVRPPRFYCSDYGCSKCRTGSYTVWVYDPKSVGALFQHQVVQLCDLGCRYGSPTPYDQGIIHFHTLLSPTSY